MTDLLRALSTVLVLAIPSAALAQQGRPEAGRAFAEANCARCHAIGRTGASPLAAAPPFRTLKEQYPIEALAEPLAEGISAGHAEMPERAFAPEDVDAILAFLGTL